MMYPYQIESSQSSQCYHPLKQKLRNRKNLTIDVDTNDTLPSYKIPFICGNLHIFDSCPVCLKYKCYFSSECDGTSPDKSIPINLYNQHYGCHYCLPSNKLSREPIST